MPKVATYNVSGEVSSRAKEELLGELLEAYRSLLRMLRVVCDRVTAGALEPSEIANLLTGVAWHIDRAVAMMGSSEGAAELDYEKLIKRAREEAKSLASG